MREKVRSVNMEWSIPDTTFSEYFYSLHGQIEYWLLWAMMGQMRGKWWKTPLFWSGAQNSIVLYLEHCSYSPFLDHPTLGNPKTQITWDMRDVPGEQKDTVDENFLPKNL